MSPKNRLQNFVSTKLATGVRRICHWWIGLVAWVLLFVGLSLGAPNVAAVNAKQISFSRPSLSSSISVSADQITRWKVGQYDVLHLQGNVSLGQQPVTAVSNEAILWVEIPETTNSGLTSKSFKNEAPKEHKIIAYLEGNVIVDRVRTGEEHTKIGRAADQIRDEVWLDRFFTTAFVDINRETVPLGNRTVPLIFVRAQNALRQESESGKSQFAQGIVEDSSAVRQATFAQQPMVISPQTGQVQSVAPAFQTPQVPQFAQPTPATIGPQGFANQGPVNPGQTVQQNSPFSFEIFGRDSTVKPNLTRLPNPNNPNEWLVYAVGGIQIQIDSPELAGQPQFKGDKDPKLYLAAESMVNWQFTMPDGTTRNQFYLEGDVVFVKGSRAIYAERMFYDLEAQAGTILKAEILTKVRDYQGDVRLKADVVQQYDENNIQAFGSAFTTSRLGVPRYWLQSQTIGLERTQVPKLDPVTLQPEMDLTTGLFNTQDEYLVDSQKNRIYFGGVPVFAWPRLRTSLSNPSLFLDRFGVNNDRIFGFQLTTGWDMYQLLGLRQPPQGTKWIGLLDYLSERGVGVGSEFDYQRNSLFGIPGKVSGQYKSWFINDSGLDFLGRDRANIVPEEEFRGRISATHRHDFAPGYQLRAEIGYVSDRNFLEQFYEREWDTRKDHTTGFWLERNVGTQSFNLTGDLQINDFFTHTSGLNFKQFVLGQQVFNNRAIWHSQTQAGYVRMRTAEAPTTAAELAKFDPLAWEANVDGFRVGTRHEIDFPMQVGPVKVIPYLLGDMTFWQEDLSGNDLTRAYGQAGVKASLPMWKVDPAVQSVLWNVNGLAHKVNFELDAFYSDASQDLDELALYDQLDDDPQEHFRRRFAFDTFGIAPGGNVPTRYDERNYAFRSGMQGNVTAPSTEIADDLSAIKFGVRQRWQTKRGLPGRERIIDWVTLDMQTTLFPNAARDNFGADFGMFDYDFRWYVGDRFSLSSDGFFDFFSQGLRTASFGANITRPEIGDVYVGYRMIEGPISSNILTAALTYRMSDKWGVKAGGQVDFGETGTIGQTLNFVYIGESFLWQFGFNYDVSRDNLGFRFGFEPRFTNKPRLFRPGGVAIPPSGSRWLE
ncbi:MAG: organic solvent tolerance protein OstA [Mariniblastus sp.]